MLKLGTLMPHSIQGRDMMPQNLFSSCSGIPHVLLVLTNRVRFLKQMLQGATLHRLLELLLRSLCRPPFSYHFPNAAWMGKDRMQSERLQTA